MLERLKLQGDKGGIRAQQPTLLKMLGMAIPKMQCDFWRRSDLDWLLADARKAYREQAKAAHPDNGGTHEQAVQINQLWERIEKGFLNHGITHDGSPVAFCPEQAAKTPKVIAERPLSPCACGCGELTRSGNRFIHNHHRKKLAKLVECACGCGSQFLNVDQYGRTRRFRQGHAVNLRWAERTA